MKMLTYTSLWSECVHYRQPDKEEIKIIRDYDLSLPDVNADRDQLIQVMLNISVNAIQAITENKAFL